MTWEEATRAFANYLAVERAYSATTVRAYCRDLEEFCRVYRARAGRVPRPAAVIPKDIRAHVAELYGQNKGASIARKLSSLRSFFRFLARRGLIRENPARGVPSPRREKALPRALDVDDTFALVEAPTRHPGRGDDRAEALRLRDAAVLEVLYGSGLRVSECCALDLDDIDRDRFGSSLLRIRRGKGGRDRLVPLGRQGDRALCAYRSVRPRFLRASRGMGDPDALFLNYRGGRLRPRSVQRMVSRYGRLVGCAGGTPHALRHSFATHLLDQGVDLRAIQELLGHASLGSTQVYTKVSMDHIMSVYDAAHPRARREALDRGTTGPARALGAALVKGRKPC